MIQTFQRDLLLIQAPGRSLRVWRGTHNLRPALFIVERHGKVARQRIVVR